jgi:hypothetical protein
MVSTPRNEFPEFPAALSFLMLLGPDGAAASLEKRASRLRATASAMDEAMTQSSPGIPRVTLLENEYQRTMIAAELAWTDGILKELRTGALNWTQADFGGAADANRQE